MRIDTETPRPRGRPRKNGIQPDAIDPTALPTPDLSGTEAEGPKSDDWGTLGPNQITEENRRPLGRLRPKLEAGDVPPGFHCRWVNDTDKGRVREALEAGYEFMKGDDGKPVQRVVGVKKGGGPLVAYRMKLPIHWYLKDQAEKTSNRAQRRSDMIRGVSKNGAPGEDGRYAPTRGNSLISRIEHEDMGKKG